MQQKSIELVGEVVKRQRKSKSLTQVELAEKAGVGRAYLSQIESLRLLPSEDILEKIAKALDDNLDIYVRALRREKFLKKEQTIFTDRTTRHKLELNNLEYLLDSAEISFQYFGFSSVVFVSNFYVKLIEFMDRGGVIRLTLAEPELKNLVNRASEDMEIRIDGHNWDHLILRTKQEHIKLMLVLSYLEELRLYHQKMKISFELSLDPDHSRQERYTIIDNSFCLHRPTHESGETFTFLVTTKDDPVFVDLQKKFDLIEHRPKPMPWDNWRELYGQYKNNFITEAKVKKAWDELHNPS